MPGLATELSSRLAVFTVSPSTVYSFLLMLPISPATALPQLMPMRMRSCGPLLALGVELGEALLHLERGAGSRAAAWSGMSSGAPNTAMIASPMYLSSVPSYLKITSVMRER